MKSHVLGTRRESLRKMAYFHRFRVKEVRHAENVQPKSATFIVARIIPHRAQWRCPVLGIDAVRPEQSRATMSPAIGKHVPRLTRATMEVRHVFSEVSSTWELTNSPNN